MNEPDNRIRVLILFGLILIGILVIRLIDLQVIRHSYFTNIAEAQRKRAAELLPHRGTIYVNEGRGGDIFPIASNQKGFTAYAVPRDMEDPGRVASELAPQLLAFRQRQNDRTQEIITRTGQELYQEDKEEDETSSPEPQPTPSVEDQTKNLQSEIFAKFNQKTDPYEPILRPYEALDQPLRTFLEEKQYPGVVLEEKEVRVYPEKELAAHTIGYLGFDGERQIGRYGIEGFFDNILKGDLGWLSGERDTAGGFIGVANNEFQPATDGADIVLTIDRVVQSIIEEELKTGVERYGARRGSVVVMNPKTGAVLGMATYPTFDPNAYYAINDPRVQLNPVVSDIFEPGSILKPVIMASAIEEGVVTPSTTFTDDGPVKVDKYTINTFDGQHFGLQTMTQVLEKSNNIGMVWLGQKMGAEMMYDFLRRFGVGERTGIELEGETQTNLREPASWNITTTATTSFGQGIALTPIQALNAINVIANNGRLMQPHIVSRLKYRDGQEKNTEPKQVRQVVSPRTANKVSAMMVSVIENGFATAARVPGYYMAGKTGTAQVADERGKYSEDEKIISFAGFGPLEDPAFSILVKLDNPYGLSFASGTAAPMFKNMSTKLLTYYQIPPSYDDTQARKPFQVND